MPISPHNKAIIKPIEDAFHSIGYKRNLIKRNYSYSDFISPGTMLRTIDMAVFGREPMDYRTACFGFEFLKDTVSSGAIVNELRAFGAPQMFIIKNGTSEWWVNREREAVYQKEFETKKIPEFIKNNKHEWNPDKMIRLKSGFEKPKPQQIDFIDIGLLPALEHQASSKIDTLLRRILHDAEKEFERSELTFAPSNIFSIVFRLLTAKLLQDRDIKTNPDVDLSEPLVSLEAVSQYYGDLSVLNIKAVPKEILKDIAQKIKGSFSLRNLSVDTLTYVYENTFVSKKSRQELGIHSTPSYIADYVLSQMPIEELPTTKWHTLDPMCGHGIFLIAAMRRMQNLLPANWSGSRRHKFFTDKLHGIDIEPFAIEVAQFCLTLADFPQPDGWKLEIKDFFEGETSTIIASKANIVVGNPPFEKIEGVKPETPKPKELLRRILPKLPDGALVGFVLPQSFLDGNDYKSERQIFHDSFEILNITTLPDRVFQYSDAETTIFIARKSKPSKLSKVHCLHVRDADRENFRLRNSPTFKDIVPASFFKDKRQGRYFVPPFREIWEHLDENSKLSDIAEIKLGVQYELGLLKKIPKELIQNKSFPDSVPGISKVTKGFMQFTTSDIVFMSTKKDHRREMMLGAWKLNWNEPKVIIPASRMSRGPWRYAALVDKKGLMVSKRFYAVWPKSKEINVELVAALMNSPIAQAFAFCHSNIRDVHKRVYSSIPIPAEIADANGLITALVNEYIAFIKGKKEKEAKEKLIEIDTEVLKLYRLPVRLERKLLKIFLGRQRRVPFDFTGYDSLIATSKQTSREQLEAQLAQNIIDLSIQKGLRQYLKKALDIIYQSFPLIRDLRLLQEQDPETDEEWLLIDITVDGGIEEILDSYDNYVKKWVFSVPSSVRENIRLSYNIY
jgi:N-6 DNA Methylase